MPARSKLSKLMDATTVAYVEANAEDIEFRGLLTVPQKCVKVYSRSAEDYSMKTGKFSNEVDFNREKSPTTRNKQRGAFKRMMDRNMAHWQEQVDVDDAAARAATAAAAAAARVHPEFFPHHAGILPPATRNAGGGGGDGRVVVPHSAAAAAGAAASTAYVLLPVIPHLHLHPHLHPYVPPHGPTPMLHLQSTRQAPATASAVQGVGDSLVPNNLFGGSASATLAKAESMLLRLTENLTRERDERIALSTLQNQGDIHHPQMVQAKGADEGAAEQEKLKNTVSEMTSTIEVLTSQKKSKPKVDFASASEFYPIPARDSAEKKKQSAAKKKDESTPPVKKSTPPVRRSERISGRRKGV